MKKLLFYYLLIFVIFPLFGGQTKLHNEKEIVLDNSPIVNLCEFKSSSHINMHFDGPPPYYWIDVEPQELSGFYYQGLGPSSSQYFIVSGGGLLDYLYIYAPNNYEISIDDGNYISDQPIKLSPDHDFFSISETPIYVRLKDNLPVGTYNDTVSIISGPISEFVTCSGTVYQPEIVVFNPDLTVFYYYEGYGPSDEQSFTVSGNNLASDIIISPPDHYEISTESGEYFNSQNPITLTPVGGYVSFQNIYVRLKQALVEGEYNEDITVISDYAEPCIINCYGAVGPHFDYLADREYTEKGIKFVINNNCNRGSGYIPQFTNPDLIYTDFTFSVDNSIENWTITMWTDADFGAYYQNEEWHIVDNNGGQVVFNISFASGKGIVEIPVILYKPPTLSVQLSAFILNLNSQYGINVMWISQSETGLNGYYVHRGTVDDLSQATIISPLIRASNTSHQQIYLYTDKDIYEPGTYYYWLEAQDYDGYVTYYGSRSLNYEFGNNGTPDIPLVTGIRSIYPNPFNPSATIMYELEQPANVNIEIYNNRGQIVRSFAIGQKEKGRYKLLWDGTDNSGSVCGTGIYFIKMQAGKESFIKKAALIK